MASRQAPPEEKLRGEGWGANRSGRLPIIKWKIGTVIKGRIAALKKLPDTGDKKGGTIFYFDPEGGGDRVCYGAPAILLSTLEEIITDRGSLAFDVRIECIGKVPSKRGQDAWNFDVRVRE